MNVGVDFPEEGLHDDADAADLDAAAGGTRAGPDEHERNQNRLGKGRPEVEVRRRIAGGRNDGAYLEGCLGQGHAETAVEVVGVDADDGNRSPDDSEVGPDLLALEGFFHVARKEEVVGVEVDPEEDHENRDDPLLEDRVVGAAGISNGKAAGAGRSEGDAEVVENRHFPDGQNDEFRHGHEDIDEVEGHGRLLQMGHELADGRAGGLGLHEVDIGTAGKGDDGQDEDENTHAADPVGEGAPEEGGVGQCLDVGQDGSSGRGEAGYRLKQGIGIIRNLSGDDVGEGSDTGHADPGQSHGQTAFLQIEDMVLGLEAFEDGPNQERDGGHEDIGQALAFPVYEPAQGGKQHETGFRPADNAQCVENDSAVHFLECFS